MKTWWHSIAARARLTLLGAVGVIAALLAASGWWLLRPEPAVLFSDVRPQDAAMIASELDKLKVPYTLGDEGSTLLVERSQVHAVRMKLMGRDLPLNGTVGFELFNASDFGMTEFAQKINFQRALQGELTRTILSFPEIREARVHLALPEQGLFKQNAARAKAAITVHVRAGQALRTEQVGGIQRLAAAAVPGLAASEVTIVDQQGVALTRSADAGPDQPVAGSRLDLKREMESYLSRKAGAVLDKAFGPGQALASVDVTLNMDQVRVTTEDVLAAPDAKNGIATGVLVRERESARDSAAPEPRAPDGRSSRGSSMQRDVEYQAGRRVEQVVSHPGAVRRIQVVAVVRDGFDAERKEQVQRLLAAAVGASPERGDTVVVQALLPPARQDQAMPPAVPPAKLQAAGAPGDHWPVLAGAGVSLAMLAFAAGSAIHRRRSNSSAVRVLDDSQRQVALEQVRTWMLQAAPPVQAPASRRGGGGE
jgi:flagellar M-ring protein FliF